MVANVVGNGAAWKHDLFPDELIPEILELVISCWQTFQKPDRLDLEVKISQRFVDELRQEKDRRDDLPFHIWVEVQLPYNTAGAVGRTDILFAYRGAQSEQIHFAFECKRLRIPYPPPSRLTTNNSDYVGNQGMLCFVLGRYSASVRNGGMLAYVMDGNTEKAIASLSAHIQRKAATLKLSKDTGLHPSPLLPRRSDVKQTKHDLPTKHMTLHHVFLAV